MDGVQSSDKPPEGYNHREPRAQQQTIPIGPGARAVAAHYNGFEAFAPFAASVILAKWRAQVPLKAWILLPWPLWLHGPLRGGLHRWLRQCSDFLMGSGLLRDALQLWAGRVSRPLGYTLIYGAELRGQRPARASAWRALTPG